MAGIIKEAIEYVVGLRKPEVQEIDGVIYSDKELEPVIHNPKARAIQMNTLTSLVDYIKAQVDKMDEKMIVHVQSPTKVSLYSALDNERIREYLVMWLLDYRNLNTGDLSITNAFALAYRQNSLIIQRVNAGWY